MATIIKLVNGRATEVSVADAIKPQPKSDSQRLKEYMLARGIANADKEIANKGKK